MLEFRHNKNQRIQKKEQELRDHEYDQLIKKQQQNQKITKYEEAKKQLEKLKKQNQKFKIENCIRAFFEARFKEEKLLDKLEMIQATQEYMFEKQRLKGFDREPDLRGVDVFNNL